MEVPNYPCHNQAVKRIVKLVNEASLSAAGEEVGTIYYHISEKYALVLSTITSRKICLLLIQNYYYKFTL